MGPGFAQDAQVVAPYSREAILSHNPKSCVSVRSQFMRVHVVNFEFVTAGVFVCTSSCWLRCSVSDVALRVSIYSPAVSVASNAVFCIPCLPCVVSV